MTLITTIISPIPQPPQRGIDFYDDFVIKIEEYNDHIYATFQPQLESFRAEVNQVATEINTSANQVATDKNTTLNAKNEAVEAKNLALSAQTDIQNNYATYVNGTTYSISKVDVITNISHPYSGYTKVSKKLDNFVFQESNSFLNKVADKNRYLKFGDKAVDTYTHNSYDVVKGGVVADFTSTAPDVAEIVAESSGVTTVSVNKGNYVIQSRTDVTDHAQTTFRAKQDAPIGTALANTTYFEDRTEIGVTNQALAYHAYNTVTNAYEGIKTEVLFSDVSKEDLLDNPTWLARNGFSKVSEFLYSKGSYLCLPVGIWQSLNKGAYHPIFNGSGTGFFGRDTDQSLQAIWYDTVNVTVGDTEKCFSYVTTRWGVGVGGSINGSSSRPEGKYYDICYPDQFTDVREYAKALNKYEVDLIVNDKLENGVEEAISLTALPTVPYGTYLENIDSGLLITKPILSSNTKPLPKVLSNPTYYSQTMKDRLASGVGIVGLLPDLVDDTGVSNIPDGSKTVFKLGGKYTAVNQVLKSTDSGITWTTLALTSGYTINPIANTITFTTAPVSTDMILVSTTDKCLPYIQTTPLPVIDVEPKVIASNSHSIYKGALIGNQISGKIQTGNGANDYESKVLENVLLDENKDIATNPKHSAIALDSESSSASKWFETLEEGTNGVVGSVYGEEITYDGVSEWGDTDFSQLVNGTIPDVNGGSDVRTFHGVVPINGRIK